MMDSIKMERWLVFTGGLANRRIFSMVSGIGNCPGGEFLEVDIWSFGLSHQIDLYGRSVVK